MLLVLSYSVNHLPLLVFGMLLHDYSDVLIELAKVFAYMRLEIVKSLVFAMFALLWVSTRVVVYPMHLMRATLFDSLEHAAEVGMQLKPYYQIANALLLVMWGLNVYWSYFILAVLYKRLVERKMYDVREQPLRKTRSYVT